MAAVISSPALDAVLKHPGIWRRAAARHQVRAIASGHAELDALLPGGGWPSGELTELFCSRDGIGELALLMPALARLTAAGKRVLWLAPPHVPYAPALAAAGIDLAHLAIVQAPGRRDALWAAEQALRACSCHALVAWLAHARYDELRRLAVAAEASPAWTALFRPPEAAHDASPAVLRLALEPQGEALGVRILKRRGAPLAAPLALAVQRPFHALGRHPFPVSAAGARADRRVGLPVHA